jgi:Uma2 family endonuclease
MPSCDAPHADPELPDIDERLVAPENRYEILDGAIVHVAPAHEPHAIRHSKISALVEAHVAPELDVASDMLTRTSEIDDIAPDVSVFPSARDPRTGGRQLEQLAFEVVSTESLGHAARKAEKLARRGVRRVFAIDIERGRALEWSPALGTWSMLDATAQIEDPALAVPLPIAALLHAAKADDAVARALIARRNPEIEAVRAKDRAEGLEEGIARGKAEAVVELLGARGLAVSAAERDRILGERDAARLARWMVRAIGCAAVAELFAEP